MSRKSYKVRDDSAALAVYSIVSNRVSSGAALSRHASRMSRRASSNSRMRALWMRMLFLRLAWLKRVPLDKGAEDCGVGYARRYPCNSPQPHILLPEHSPPGLVAACQ